MLQFFASFFCAVPLPYYFILSLWLIGTLLPLQWLPSSPAAAAAAAVATLLAVLACQGRNVPSAAAAALLAVLACHGRN
eukprot:976959-Pelagomonas_calceolata.AAC.1